MNSSSSSSGQITPKSKVLNSTNNNNSTTTLNLLKLDSLNLLNLNLQEELNNKQQEYNPIISFPPEIILLIIQNLYFSIITLPEDFPSPDPHLKLIKSTTITLTTTIKPIFSPIPSEELRKTFTKLALINRTWSILSTNYLWKSINFDIPRAFESVLRTIEEYSTGKRILRLERVNISHSQGSSSTTNNSGWSFDSIVGT